MKGKESMPWMFTTQTNMFMAESAQKRMLNRQQMEVTPKRHILDY